MLPVSLTPILPYQPVYRPGYSAFPQSSPGWMPTPQPVNPTLFPSGVNAGFPYQQQPVFTAPVWYPSGSTLSSTSGKATPAPTPSMSLNPDGLTPIRGMAEGLKSGLIFTLLAAAPIYWIEKKTGQLPFLTGLIHVGTTAPSAAMIAKWSSNPSRVMTSVGGTALIGFFGGMGLGWWVSHRVKGRIEEINEARQAMRQGTFQVKKPTLFQKLRLSEPSITDPESAAQTLVNHDLSPGGAFQNWAYLTAVLKLVPATFTSAVGGLLILGLKRAQPEVGQLYWDLFKTAWKNPLLWIKSTALPLMGGFIGSMMVPWMRQQVLSSTHATSAPKESFQAFRDETGFRW